MELTSLLLLIVQCNSSLGLGPRRRGKFLFWEDYPGATAYRNDTKWWDQLKTRAGSSFITDSDVKVEVNWNNDRALHLWADPRFNQIMDQRIRDRNGPESHTMSGTMDPCGWPGKTPSEASAAMQRIRRTEPLNENFEQGLSPDSLVVMQDKGCCSKRLEDNVDLVRDTVDGVRKPVLRLRAHSMDSGCPGTHCKKHLNNTGVVATADLFGSGRYEVRAKVPQASGMVWAIWTFHGEER